ncbi:MAG: HEPN domain-containing protein [Actinobacteria bacterium]|nr:HEPN domain-containing protein [Actinomycetota bacterium]
MKRQKVEDALRWVLQSGKDLEAAKYNFGGRLFNVACFLAQQSAEKMLKAFLIKHGDNTIWGHSVADLVDDCSHIDSSFESLFRIAGPLDKYYIPTRYPDGLPGGIPSNAYIEEDAKMAISMAEEIMDFVKSKENFYNS